MEIHALSVNLIYKKNFSIQIKLITNHYITKIKVTPGHIIVPYLPLEQGQ